MVDVGPVDTPASSFSGLSIPSMPTGPTFEGEGLAVKPMRPFGPASLSDPGSAYRFRMRDLATPSPLSGMPGDRWGGGISFAAPAESTGLGFDMSLTPRASIEVDRAGNNITSTGAELKLGPDLADRDLRGLKAATPSWYFFVGTDNEALVWNFADRQAMDGATLRDQATVGDLQTGVAMSMGEGAQMSFGLVERKLEFNDIGGDQDVNKRERFAALSYTLHH